MATADEIRAQIAASKQQRENVHAERSRVDQEVLLRDYQRKKLSTFFAQFLFFSLFFAIY